MRPLPRPSRGSSIATGSPARFGRRPRVRGGAARAPRPPRPARPRARARPALRAATAQLLAAGRQRLGRDRDPFAARAGAHPVEHPVAGAQLDLGAGRGAAGDHRAAVALDPDDVEARPHDLGRAGGHVLRRRCARRRGLGRLAARAVGRPIDLDRARQGGIGRVGRATEQRRERPPDRRRASATARRPAARRPSRRPPGLTGAAAARRRERRGGLSALRRRAPSLGATAAGGRRRAARTRAPSGGVVGAGACGLLVERGGAGAASGSSPGSGSGGGRRLGARAHWPPRPTA